MDRESQDPGSPECALEGGVGSGWHVTLTLWTPDCRTDAEDLGAGGRGSRLGSASVTCSGYKTKRTAAFGELWGIFPLWCVTRERDRGLGLSSRFLSVN